MTSAHDSIQRLLDESTKRKHQCLDRIEREKRQLDLIEAEISSYHKVLAAIGGAPVELPIAPVKKPPAQKTGRKRGLIQKWRAIFSTAYHACKEPYSYDELALAASMAGYDVAAPALRTQMMNSVNTGLFERVDAGRFRITEAGKKAIGVENNEAPAEAGASNVSEAGDAASGVAGESEGSLLVYNHPTRTTGE